MLFNTGCFFSNDTVRLDFAQPVLDLETSTLGQIKGIYMRFCMLSTKSLHIHVWSSSKSEKKYFFFAFLMKKSEKFDFFYWKSSLMSIICGSKLFF